ncbi:MAG: MoaD/ThiS family protein [SAR202 cluster bacterium]|nr:molybdopterin synthase sulfur carrier subunit [Chloroflexota bacterium]MQF95533.1 MoaD/ThiS family protein [SAR202 cluster bacterium]MQG33714.1 MoaD/ThiS family protein [SAR202 cluster bacterium]HCL25797.1 molybdopterin synthase sulfur carrier subunit [Dehalococcoidia bacterium]HCP24783.1 molybdopterin synthase sulfur carrier subunit [Dehalococcoidia bacterium]
MPEVWIPPKLQQLTGGKQQVQVEGGNVRQVINSLERDYPGIKEYLVDDEQQDLVPGLAVIIDGETSLLGMLEKVQENSEVHFLPAIGGG